MNDLVTWLRAQLDDDERAAHAWLPLGNPADADRDHIARVDPARVLAEVDAKRRIIAAYESHADAQFPDYSGGYASAMEDAVQILALPYADRPGWREEWRCDTPG